MAAANGHVDVVKLLLEGGAVSVSVVVTSPWIVFHVSCYTDRKTIKIYFGSVLSNLFYHS